MERRLAAIVAIDVVGYSRLMGSDESGTLAAVGKLRTNIIDPAIGARGGRLVKTMGDGFLLEFASAVEAVECAADVQARVADFEHQIKSEQPVLLRVGVNVGDIIVQDGDVFGDGVNVAARLEGLADPGGILLSRAAYDQVRDKVDHVFEDLGEHSLKNIARPVQVFRLASAQARAAAQPRGDFCDLRAVAVLPFDNLSGNPAEEYFVDGLTEDIITALSYWRWFPVVARNSTFAYKGKAKNITEIGRELEAAYVVEGSARRSGEQVRITVQLIEAATGHHLFADRYDRRLADVFLVQDEIAERIVVNIEPEIHRAEARRSARKHPSDLNAWDHALKALSLQERMTPAGHAEARHHLELALDIDSNSARAWSLLSLCHYHEGILGWAGHRGDALHASLEAAERAVSCDDRDWLGQALRGMGRMWTERDFASALEGEESAVALNPSAPLARHFLSCVLEFSGRPADALPHLEAILRLDPRYRFRSLALADQSLCHFLIGNLDKAIQTAETAVRIHPGNVRARQRLVAGLSSQGLGDAAATAAQELSRLQPTLDIAYIDETYPFMLPEQRDTFVGALRRAGLLDK